ncbi:PREDICTED: DNA-directed primase/polymerase protein-like [Ceratosolen solmsi marchali]|uniref:DNA-directed primase/polymerase protein n=1 Tax=Ceratosolen solmsi marchali TaxID=326594 RepID=A0AAJ6YG28_9HYME|nr:PREDICTED: DNA-directed primase/polymerase protein-like [Ceratosolen solmsi marchali]
MNEQGNVPIVSGKFYGTSLNGIYDDLEKRIEQTKRQQPANIEYKPKSLLQPSRYKEEFWKQNEALANAIEFGNDDVLCCFVFQNELGKRRFIVTHPEDMWEDFEHVPMEKRVFYEVIPENLPCFLYYDIEFETDINKDKDGIKMTSTLIDITCEYIAKYWNYRCEKSVVINLDSSRDGKFSKHLIFSTKDVAFKNNFEVGCLVKKICFDIISLVSSENSENDILSKFNKSELEELFVKTTKGKKLFVDLNVYTKNRHFRIYKATKWGKNSHLVHAKDCKCHWNKKSRKSNDFDLFINSLLSYLPNAKKLGILSFNDPKSLQIQHYSQSIKAQTKQCSNSKLYSEASYNSLNNFISNLIKPGRIRDMKHIANNHVIFEIVGNRFCQNIGRWHKSNNIYFVIDLNKKVMYQKCHDEDCQYFTSVPKKLPVEVAFYFEDETDCLFSTIED